MKHDQAHINQLIKAYREDTISKADRHYLEKLALDDPMLFDALEGFTLYKSQHNTTALSRINAKITTPKGRIISLQNLSIAAGLIILLGAMFLLNRSIAKQDTLGQATLPKTEQLEKPTNDPTDAVENEQESPSELIQNQEQLTSGPDLESISLEGNSSSNKQPSKPEEIDISQRNTDPVISGNNRTETSKEQEEREAIISRTKLADEEIDVQSDQSASIPKRAKVGKVKPAQVQTQVQTQTQTQVQTQASLLETSQSKVKKHISGRIRDITGEPLIGATILLDNFSEAAITGVNGHFELELVDLPSDLYVSYTELNRLKVALVPGTTAYDLVLEESEELSEVVVFGFTAKVTDDGPKFLLPPGGRSNFKKVIVARSDQSTCDQKGIVRLIFTVDTLGQVADFVINKSLSGNCDQEAIQIIKNSGRWDNPFDSHKKVRYTISF